MSTSREGKMLLPQRPLEQVYLTIYL